MLNLRKIFNALEKERERIAMDLHDELTPMLSAVKMRINSFELNDMADQVQLEKTNEIIDEIAARIRTISFDLMPASLQTKGLAPVLRELVNNFSGKYDLNIRLRASEQPLVLSEQKSVHLYRIVLEIIHNTIKHAKASKLLITLNQEDSQLILLTQDDGIGFDYEKQKRQNYGLGLNSIANRMKILDGKFSVVSKPGIGTSYFFGVPLKN